MSTRLDGATRLYPIVGDPIRFVESPARLTRTFAERGHNAVCVPMLTPAGSLDAVLAGLTATPNVDGILVTMPHKHAALHHCATTSERARALGAVSVMRRSHDGTWHGDMLDGVAFVAAQQELGARVEGARALLVGAGAAGTAIAAALLAAGVQELVVHDLDPSRVADLLGLVGLLALPDGRWAGRVLAGPPDPSGCDLVLNATPMGLATEDPIPVDPSLLRSSMFVGDVIAGHGATPLIAAARSIGCRTATGSDMVAAVQDLMADFMLEALP